MDETKLTLTLTVAEYQIGDSQEYNVYRGYALLVGPFDSLEEADAAIEKMRASAARVARGCGRVPDRIGVEYISDRVARRRGLW